MEIEFVDMLPGKVEAKKETYGDLKTCDWFIPQSRGGMLHRKTTEGYLNISEGTYGFNGGIIKDEEPITLYEVKIYAAVKR